jgi:hypothetical protein
MLIKNDGKSCGIFKTGQGNNVVGPTNAFAAVIMELGDNGWLDYGSCWLKNTGTLVKIGSKGGIATNATVWWFTR